MDHKKQLLTSRIAQIHDPVQKRLLQDVLVDVFGELLTYSEESFDYLEQKIDRTVRAAVCLKSIGKKSIRRGIWVRYF